MFLSESEWARHVCAASRELLLNEGQSRSLSNLHLTLAATSILLVEKSGHRAIIRHFAFASTHDRLGSAIPTAIAEVGNVLGVAVVAVVLSVWPKREF